MSWLPVLLLAFAGFFVGGAWSFRKQANRIGFWILMALAALCVVAAILWSGSPT